MIKNLTPVVGCMPAFIICAFVAPQAAPPAALVLIAVAYAALDRTARGRRGR